MNFKLFAVAFILSGVLCLSGLCLAAQDDSFCQRRQFPYRHPRRTGWIYPATLYDAAVYGVGSDIVVFPEYYDSTYYTRGGSGFGLRDEKVRPGFVIHRKKNRFFAR